jgi:hypothetical protein
MVGYQVENPTMTAESPLIPRTIFADPSRGNYWCLWGVLIALIGIVVGTTTGPPSAITIVLAILFTLMGSTTFLVNLRMTKKRLPSITLTPEGIHYYTIFFDREFREWKQLGHFSVAMRPGAAWNFSNVTYVFRQYAIVAQDETSKPLLVPPPPDYTGGKYDKEIWISIRRSPMGEDTTALNTFVNELNEWRERYGSGEGSPKSD